MDCEKENSNRTLSAFHQITDLLNKEISILCWTTTIESNHKTRAVHIKATWARRCTKHLFISNVNDSDLGAIKLVGIGEGKKKKKIQAKLEVTRTKLIYYSLITDHN